MRLIYSYLFFVYRCNWHSSLSWRRYLDIRDTRDEHLSYIRNTFGKAPHWPSKSSPHCKDHWLPLPPEQTYNFKLLTNHHRFLLELSSLFLIRTARKNCAKLLLTLSATAIAWLVSCNIFVTHRCSDIGGSQDMCDHQHACNYRSGGTARRFQWIPWGCMYTHYFHNACHNFWHISGKLVMPQHAWRKWTQ